MRHWHHVLIAVSVAAWLSVTHAQTPVTTAGSAAVVVSRDMLSQMPELQQRIVQRVDLPGDRVLAVIVRQIGDTDPVFDGPLAGNLVPIRPNQRRPTICQQCDDDGLTEHNVQPVTRGDYAQLNSAGIMLPSPPLTGAGVRIAVIDIGLVYSAHPEFLTQSGVETSSRVTPATPWNVADPHATQDAGTMAARGVNPHAQGAAPAALITSIAANGPAYWSAVDAIANDVAISSHSTIPATGWDDTEATSRWWGIAGQSRDRAFGAYDADAAFADGLASTHPSHLIVVAAGNDRGDGPSVTLQQRQPLWHEHQVARAGTSMLHWERDNDIHPPDDADGGYKTVSHACVAKNVLCVGALLDQGPHGEALVTSFSNFGPSNDLRIKPDVMANGADVFSLSTDPTHPYISDQRPSGTSQATPMAAGIAALVYEAFTKFKHRPPSAVETKAVLIHTARMQNASGPEPGYGWGRLDAKAAVQLVQSDSARIDTSVVNVGTDTVLTIARTALAPSGVLRVTVAWNDPPAAPTWLDSDVLVNDVDATLTDPGGEPHYPYSLMPNEPYTATNKTPNHHDNIEVIDVPDRVGTWTLTLRADRFGSGTTQPVTVIVAPRP